MLSIEPYTDIPQGTFCINALCTHSTGYSPEPRLQSSYRDNFTLRSYFAPCQFHET